MAPGHTLWPADLAERYRAEGLWAGRTLGDLLRDSAAAHGSRTAIVSDELRWTYAELDARADRLAAGLAALGLRAGDRVVVQLPNVPEFVVLCFALFRLGVMPVLALPAHRAVEIGHLAEISDATAYFGPAVHDGFEYPAMARGVAARVPSLRHLVVVGESDDLVAFERLDAEPEERVARDPGDVALFLLSGGTTGLPKLIPRTHDDYFCGLRLSAENARLSSDDVYLAVLPIAHNYALAAPGLLGTLHAGGTAVLAADGNPQAAFETIERERVTVTGLVPPLCLLWTRYGSRTDRDLSSLRLVQVGGAPVPPSVARAVTPALGCKLQQSFGMAEGLLSQSAPDDPDELTMTAQGRPLSSADEVRVVGEDGLDVPDGKRGELLVRGPYTIRGYYRAPEYDAETFTDDGFLRTGDLVRRGASGHLHVEGRIKDVVNRGGDKVGAEEVEDHLLEHDAVADAAIVAMPDDVMGERTCAYVVADGTAPELPELRRFLEARGLATYKVPDRIEVVDGLPHTGVGKVDKSALRAAIADTVAAERSKRAAR